MLRSCLAACVTALTAIALMVPAGASPVPLAGIVSEDPANFTPHITVGNAPFAAVPIGGRMYVGGAFTQVKNATRSQTYARKNLFAFNMSDGSVTSLSIAVNGDVLALATDGTSLYVGGKFHGRQRRRPTQSGEAQSDHRDRSTPPSTPDSGVSFKTWRSPAAASSSAASSASA